MKTILNIKILFFTVTIIVSLFSCNPDNAINNKSDSANQKPANQGNFNMTENLKLSIPDTIKKSAYYFFSNSQTKDLFLLTIEPGMVKESKSTLAIINPNNQVIYSQTFDTYYFIKWIFEPQRYPDFGGNNEAYDIYIETYCKSLTPKQYETYFRKSVNTFFEDISLFDRSKFEELDRFEGDINDNDFLNEYLEDTTIQLFDITCFDCDEGGYIIGYSKKQNKVVTLVDHD